MKQSFHHGHFAAWSVLVLVIGLALLCPDFAVATDRPVYGGLGGNYFRAECPKGSYLVGLDGRAGAWVDRIAPVCAPWRRGSQTFGAPSVGQSFGTSEGGQEHHESCLGSGINNRAVQSWNIETLKSDNRFVQYIGALCISLAPSASIPSYGPFEFGPKPAVAPGDEPLDSIPTRSDRSVEQKCPAGEIAVGIHGRAGKFLDAVGLICGPLPTKLSAPPTKVNPLATAPATAATKANPLVKAPVPSDDMFTITKPTWNDRVQQGNLIVAAKQPKVGMTPVTQLEFKWLDAPKTQPYVNAFSVDTAKLLQGYPIDQQVTRGHAGRWEVRARTSGKAVPGPWSFPVQFHLFLTQPTQSQKQSSPVPQSAPLPSSSAVQPPSQESSAATQMIRPPTTPSQGSSGFSGMIRRRGVEEKESVDPAPDTEKKP